MALHDAVVINCKNGATTENQGEGVKYICLRVHVDDCVCVIWLDITTLHWWSEKVMVYYIILLLLLLLLKPARQAQVGKTKCFVNWTENWRNHNSGNNQRLTAPLNPSSYPMSITVKRRSFHIRTMGQQETPCKLERNTPSYNKLQWMRCVRSVGCRT